MKEEAISRRLSIIEALFSTPEEMEALLALTHGDRDRHKITDRIARDLFEDVASGKFKYCEYDEKLGRNIKWPAPDTELRWAPPERFGLEEKTSLMEEVCTKYKIKCELASTMIISRFREAKSPLEVSEIVILALEKGVFIKNKDSEIDSRLSWPLSMKAFDIYLYAIYRFSKSA